MIGCLCGFGDRKGTKGRIGYLFPTLQLEVVRFSAPTPPLLPSCLLVLLLLLLLLMFLLLLFLLVLVLLPSWSESFAEKSYEWIASYLLWKLRFVLLFVTCRGVLWSQGSWIPLSMLHSCAHNKRHNDVQSSGRKSYFCFGGGSAYHRLLFCCIAGPICSTKAAWEPGRDNDRDTEDGDPDIIFRESVRDR